MKGQCEKHARQEAIRVPLELIQLENILGNVWADNEYKPEKHLKNSNKNDCRHGGSWLNSNALKYRRDGFPDKKAHWGSFRLTAPNYDDDQGEYRIQAHEHDSEWNRKHVPEEQHQHDPVHVN